MNHRLALSFTMELLTIASSEVVLAGKETAHCEGDNASHSRISQEVVFIQ